MKEEYVTVMAIFLTVTSSLNKKYFAVHEEIK